MNDRDKSSALDSPATVKRILRVFYVICAVLFALDLVLSRHTIHTLEAIPGFYAIFGFACCVILVVIAKWMRTFLMRDETYYDNELKDGNDVDA
ncbi:MAG: hypothetical protein WD002_03295 [Pseudomonadales bacterium]